MKYAHFFCKDVIGPSIGPLEGVQLTYATLRHVENGATLAYLVDDGCWQLHQQSYPEHGEQTYTDVVFLDEPAEGSVVLGPPL